MNLSILVAAVLVSSALPPDRPAADPTAELFARLGKLDPKSAAADFKPFVHPTSGLDVDASSEGASKPVMVHLDSGSLEKNYANVVRPLVAEGLFKAGPKCSPEGQKYRCTLQTPASLPRTCTVEPHSGKWYLTRIEWVREEPGEGDGDDDDLPM